jgi:hypothetical protein
VLCQTAAGAGRPHVVGDALMGFIEQSTKFLKLVPAGDAERAESACNLAAAGSQ